jgi:chromobox protein 5
MKFRVVEEDNRKSKKIREFLVRWKGYSAEHDTWEPADNLTNCPSILEKYKKEHQLI